MGEQVTLEWVLAKESRAPAWYALDSRASTTDPCEPDREELIAELRELRAELASLIAVIGVIAENWAQLVDVQTRNAVPPHVFAQLEAIVRRRRARF
jgi:hypothetical protein